MVLKPQFTSDGSNLCSYTTLTRVKKVSLTHRWGMVGRPYADTILLSGIIWCEQVIYMYACVCVSEWLIINVREIGQRQRYLQ